MSDQDLIYKIGLTLVKGVGDVIAKQLIKAVDNNIEQLFREKKQLLERLPGISSRIVSSLQDPEVLRRAEQELKFIQKNRIRMLFINDADYPQRLRDCIDSPVLLYYKGNADLNTQRIISIVGTRHATEYGRNIIEQIVSGLAAFYPDLLVVSGLAYGIDIIAHREALNFGLNSIGVLAHGLDRIYPSQHRNTAINMIENGGLLTEFISGTNPDRQNFVMRNRIVAGMSDGTLVVESAIKGGALITSDLAFGYGRDVLAIPGRHSDVYSQGCNKIIKENKAALVESAEDIVKALCWDAVTPTKQKAPVQTQLFSDLTEQEQVVYDILRINELQLNLLSIQCDMPIHRLTSLLFEMEMKGIVRCLPGGIYKIN